MCKVYTQVNEYKKTCKIQRSLYLLGIYYCAMPRSGTNGKIGEADKLGVAVFGTVHDHCP